MFILKYEEIMVITSQQAVSQTMEEVEKECDQYSEKP